MNRQPAILSRDLRGTRSYRGEDEQRRGPVANWRQASHRIGRRAGLIAIPLLIALFHSAVAEEIWLFDNSRLYGIVAGVSADGSVLDIWLPGGDVKHVPLETIIALRFRGRSPKFLPSGSQEFSFQRGGMIRGEVLGQASENLVAETAVCGQINIDLRLLNGLIGLPLEGAAGRRASELLTLKDGPAGPHLDVLLDRRGSRYTGVVRRIDRGAVTLDHEDVLKPVTFATQDLAGLRLADADRLSSPPPEGKVHLRFSARDGSRFDGVLKHINVNLWTVAPVWNLEQTLVVDISEIASVQIINGRVQYLSQLTPSAVNEKTLIAPPHPFQIDRNCGAGTLAVGGRTFPWGVGVHANSELTYSLGGQFKEFIAVAGLDEELGGECRVVFKIRGDGKELFKSAAVTRGDAPLEISAPIAGVKQLVLSVEAQDGNDLGAAADWCVARLSR